MGLWFGWLVVVLAICQPLKGATANDLTISNLKYGLICGSKENRHICYQGGDIQITNESACTYNNHPEPCTWYGYSFDYTAIPTDEFLDCEWSSDQSVNLGNPHEELARKISRKAFKLPIYQNKTHFFNPLYASSPSNSTRFPDNH